MAKFMIEHDRPNCIGCGACAAVSPSFWKMNPNDGKSDLVGAKDTKNNGSIVKSELDLDDIVSTKNREAADCCPVNVIHIIDLQKKTKII